MRILKVALIVFFSIIGIAGAAVLGLYLTGKLEEPIIPPADIFYADVTFDEEGNKTYIAHTDNYFVADNFELIIGTTSTEYTQNKLNLDFGTQVAKKYVKINNESLTPYCYSLDENGNQVKYVLAEEADADYITNGKLIAPKTVKIGKAFKVFVCVAPDDDFEGTITEDTKLYNIGGSVVLYAQSEVKSLSRINTTINIDVPVSEIKIIPCTSNGSADKVLDSVIENNKVYYLVNLESYFGLQVEYTPKRSAYAFGKDGQTGTAEYKQIIFTLNNDEDKIALVDADGNVIAGVSDLARFMSLLSGDGEVFASVYKNSIDYYANKNLSLQEQLALLNGEMGLKTSANVRVTNITIDGFEMTDKYQGIGNELVFDINNRLILTANNDSKYNSLLLNILADGYSQGAVQKEIKNIYLSMQVYKNGAWVDATTGENKYFEFIGSEVYTNNIVTSDYYGFNFYKVNFNRNLPDNSFWEIVALANNENADYSAIRIQAFYMSNDGLVEDNAKYGPYEVECVVAEIVAPEVDWKEDIDYKTSDKVIADERNEEIFLFEQNVPSPITIDLTNLAKITNLNENPANTLIKFFLYSDKSDLNSLMNCKIYTGEIEGLSNDAYVYEVLSDEKLIISSLGDYSQFDFNLIFVVVQNDYRGSAILDNNGNYIIKAVPTMDNGTLISVPFRISKTVELNNETLNFELKKSHNPYGQDAGAYLIPKSKDCLELSIKIKTIDIEIFKQQIAYGNIILTAMENDSQVEYFYYLDKGIKYSLAQTLITYFDNNPAGEVDGEYTKYSIILSTENIDFVSEEIEKHVYISLNYTIKMQNGDVKQSVKTNDINIYSGKINDLVLNYENGKFVGGGSNYVIYISKIIDNNTIKTTYKLNDVNGEEINIFDVNGYLNLSFTKYGINDLIEVTSNANSVLQVSYETNNGEMKFKISALKSDKATLTIKANYSAQNAIVINFVIDSQFEILSDDSKFREGVALDDKVSSTKVDGILSYDKIRGYTILGAPIKSEGGTYTIDDENYNVQYNFADLVRVWLKKGESTIDVTNKLKFSVDLPTGLNDYIELIEDVNGETIGFKPIKKLGVQASIIVYYYNNEMGFNSGVVIINLAPYYQAQGSIANHDGATISQQEPDAKFVFAEADIDITNFNILGFDLSTGTYKEPMLSALQVILNVPNGVYTNDVSNGVTLLGEKQATLTASKGAPTKIVFSPVAEQTKYTIKFIFTNQTGAYDFAVEYVFYVEPNVKVDESKVSKTDGDIHYINSYENPFNIGDSLTLAEYIERKLAGSEAFDSDNYLSYKVYVFNAEVPSEFIKGTSITIPNANTLTLFELIINYGGKEFKFRFYAQPSIDISSASKITYNGKEYISLYAGQDSLSGFNFGSLINSDKILSYVELCKLAEQGATISTEYKGFNPNTNKADVDLKISLNEFGLLETYIVAVDGNNYVVYKAMIFPAKWSSSESYIKYSGTTETDVYKILNGDVYKTISSGESISNFADDILSSNFSYKIYDITTGDATELDVKNNTFIYIDRITSEIDEITIKTNPMGVNKKFKITFTVLLDPEGKYNYEFSYYVLATQSQTINIHYPYLEGLDNSASDNFEISHKVYYDEFTNGIYTIDLASSDYNMFGEKYVELSINSAEITSGSWNVLSYTISELYINNVLVTNNISNYIEISETGVVTLKDTTSQTLNILIKITTENGAKGYYKISVQNRAVNYVLVDTADSDKEFTKTTIGLSDLTLLDGTYYYDLSNLDIRMKTGGSTSTVEGLTLKFAVLKGEVLQTTDDIIYYYCGYSKTADKEIVTDRTYYTLQDGKYVKVESPNAAQLANYYEYQNRLIVKSSPNQQEATLYAFSQEGIVAKIVVDIASPIKISQTTGGYDGGQNNIKGLYGDQTVNLFDYLTITYNGTNVTEIANYKFELKEKYSGVSISGSTLKIEPLVGQSSKISIKVELWDSEKLLGTNENVKCTYTLNFTIMPNIVVSNQTANATANNSFTWNSLGSLFALKKETGYSYKLESVDTSNLLPEELKLYSNENLGISFSGTTLTFNPQPVMAPRQVVVIIGIYKNSTDADPLTTGTLTITINPDTDVEIKYDNFGTNQTMNSYLIYNKDYESLDIELIGKYITPYLTSDKDKTLITDTTRIILKTSSNYIVKDANNVITIYNNNSIQLTADAQRITENKSVVIEIWVDKLLRKTFTLTICKDPVFTARFDNGLDEINEELLKNEVTGNPFWFVDGIVAITTNANRYGSTFIIPVIARSRLTGIETVVYIGGKEEDNEAGLATLYFYTKRLGEWTQGARITTTTLSNIFIDKDGKNTVDIATCEFYFGAFESNVNQVVSPSGLSLTQPTKKITYFFNGYEMPLNVAQECFMIEYYSVIDEYNISFDYYRKYYIQQGDVYKKIEFKLDNNELLYMKTFDNSIIDGKSYYKYNAENGFVLVETPIENEIANYYEAVYQKTTDAAIIEGTEYYTINNGIFEKVAAPNADGLSNYYIRSTNSNRNLWLIGNVNNVSNIFVNVIWPYIDEFKIDSYKGTTYFKLLNRISFNTIVKYSYTVVKDYKLDDTKFADSPASGSTSSVTKDTYEANEFDSYGSKYVVSKTIELTAGNSYSLIGLLIDRLGLTPYRGGNYSSNETVFLTHGKFTTNNNYNNNLGSLISLQANTDNTDYTITPNGAQKGGDIVHLVVRFGATALTTSNTYKDVDTYIIRIRIMPNITITPTSPSGEIILSYPTSGSADLSSSGLNLISGGSETPLGETQFYNIPLSKLVTISGNYDISKMVVSVGSGSEYVVGTGYANRLGILPDSSGTYGIQFKKTIFGGNLITLTISDRFGYKETITISYLNEHQISPTILSVPGSIYEGEQFILAFYIGIPTSGNNAGKKTYTCFGHGCSTSGTPLNETELADENNVIIIDGFDKIAMNDGSVDTSYITNLTKTLQASKGSVEETNYVLGYNDNNIFKNAISLLPSEFGLKLTLKVDNAALGSDAKETVVLDINTALNQKYKVVAKSPYSKYSTIYLGQNNSYDLSKLFEVWDLQAGAAVNNITPSDNSTPNGYLTSVGTSYTFSGALSFTNKISETQETNFQFALSGTDLSVIHTYTFNIALTPQYYSIKMEGDGVDSTYGIVVDGEANKSYSGANWRNSIAYYDYYGNKIEISGDPNSKFEILSGTGSWNNEGKTELKDLSANSPVTIQVNCNGVEIGQVLVTMRRYYGLTGGGTTPNIGTTNILDFDVWAKEIQAFVVRGGQEDLISGISLFTYSTVSSGYDIIYENGEYKLKKLSGNFAAGNEIVVVVNYMSKQLGAIRIAVSADRTDVAVVNLNFNSSTKKSTNNINLALDTNEENNKKINFNDWASAILVYNSANQNSKVSLQSVYSLFTVAIETEGYTFDENHNIVKSDDSAFTAGIINIKIKITYKSDGDCGSQTLKFNLKRYYGLTGGGTTTGIGSTDTLSFDVWTKGIQALVDCGTDKTAEKEALTSDDSLFTYSTVTSGYDIIYENGEYKLKKLSGNFAAGDEIVVVVNYMSKQLGAIRIAVSADRTDVAVVNLNFNSSTKKSTNNINLALDTNEENNKKINFNDWASEILVYNSANQNSKVSLQSVYSLFTVAIETEGYTFDQNGNIVKSNGSAFTAGSTSVTIGITYKKADGTTQSCGSQTLSFTFSAATSGT